jgi:outer membrane protein assembly factor BamB
VNPLGSRRWPRLSVRDRRGPSLGLVVGLLATLVLGAGGVYVLWRKHEFRDVRGSSSVEFVTTRPRPQRPPLGVPWPRYGYDLAATRSAPYALRPPFRRIWTFNDNPTLLEFPPAVGYGRLFLPTWDGRFLALDARTGRVRWRHRTGRCGWGSPAIWRGLVITTYIGHECASQVPGTDGEVVAYLARTGAVCWRFRLGPCESSPLVVGGVVYVGDWHGRVYALNAWSGRPRWVFRADGAVKGSLSYAGGKVFIGAYDGHVYALDARTGRQVWRASAQSRLGPPGWFYSSPAVAHGRVYIGSTDSKVYSFGAATGRLRWSYSTGGYVYASPAVWRDLVLVGSYDHLFYAFDAATGAVRWRFRANGPISGSASVVDGIVYFSSFGRRTYGLVARTGRPVWTFPDGEYTPVVADRERVYVVGYRRVFAFASRPPS